MIEKFILRTILPLNILFDITSYFFEERGGYGILRGGVNLLVVLFVAVKYRYLWRFYYSFLVFVMFLGLNLFFCSDIFYSLNVSVKVSLSMAYFFVGFAMVKRLLYLKILTDSMLWVYGLLILNFVISNVFKLGESSYTDVVSFYNGSLRDGWNIFTYSVLVAPLVFVLNRTNRFKRILGFIGGFIVGLIALLSLKRIAIAGLVFGLSLNGWLRGSLSKLSRSVLVILVLMMLSYPLYNDILEKRFASRQDRFEEGSIEEEGRYMETFYVWKEVLGFDDPVKCLFGLEAFNSVGNYADGKFGDRQLHVDYNLIVNTIGLVGLVLYLLIFAQIYRLYKNLKYSLQVRSDILKQLHATFITLFVTQFITSMAGQMYGVTFRMIIFIFLGAICGVLLRSEKNELQLKSAN